MVDFIIWSMCEFTLIPRLITTALLQSDFLSAHFASHEQCFNGAPDKFHMIKSNSLTR